MEQTKMNFLLSVDSETGTYWHGERKLLTQAQINAIIKQAVRDQASAKDYAKRGQGPIRSEAVSSLSQKLFHGIRVVTRRERRSMNQPIFQR